jgi:parallel beta-helix repeat protein
MNNKLIGMLALVMVLVFGIGPASATTWHVNNTSDIQSIIDNNATNGDTINFTSDTGSTYTSVALTATKNLNFIGNGVTLVGTGTSNVLTISSTTGTNITGFTININGLKNGITGQYVYDCRIENNNILNGGDGINIFKQYRNLLINSNTITNMSTSYGDGISLVNCVTPETSTSTTITNNIINDVDYGIFLGGYFRGTISGNIISDCSVAGMDVTIKQGVSSLYADITDNEITGTPIGMLLEGNVPSLLLDNNYIEGTSYSIQTTGGFTYPTPHDLIVTFNTLVGTISQDFKSAVTEHHDNDPEW